MVIFQIGTKEAKKKIKPRVWFISHISITVLIIFVVIHLRFHVPQNRRFIRTHDICLSLYQTSE